MLVGVKMENILDFTLEELKEWLISKEEKAFRAKQVFDWIYNKLIFDFNNMKTYLIKLKICFLIIFMLVYQK